MLYPITEFNWTELAKAGNPEFGQENGILSLEIADDEVAIWASDFFPIQPEQELFVEAALSSEGNLTADFVVVWRTQVWNTETGEYDHIYHNQYQVGAVFNTEVDIVKGSFFPPDEAQHFRILCQAYAGAGKAWFSGFTVSLEDAYQPPTPKEPKPTTEVRLYGHDAQAAQPVLVKIYDLVEGLIAQGLVPAEQLPPITEATVRVKLQDGTELEVQGTLDEIANG